MGLAIRSDGIFKDSILRIQSLRPQTANKQEQHGNRHSDNQIRGTNLL